MFLSDDGSTLKTLDFTIYIGNTPTFLYFDLYFITAYAAHYILCFSLTTGPTLKTLDFTIYIGGISTFLYFDLYFITAYAAHYVYTKYKNVGVLPICMKVMSQFRA